MNQLTLDYKEKRKSVDDMKEDLQKKDCWLFQISWKW